MKKHLLILLLFTVLSFPGSIVAQQHIFQNYSVTDGLPHGQVHSLFQTSDGYMWIGTYGGGLTKFDGEEFTTYTTKDNLKDNSIEVIFEDSAENMWVATYKNGLAKMEGNEFVYPFEDSSLDTADVYGVGELSTGKLWVATMKSGLFIYDGTSLRRLTTEDGLVGNTVWDVWEAENGDLWIAANGGISVFNGMTYKNYTAEDGLSGEDIYRITPHSNGELWFASNDGITIWEDSSFTAVKELDGIELDYIYDLITDSEGNMWIGTYSNGVIVYSDRVINHFTGSNELSSDYIYDLYEDQNENIWIATDDDGINIYRGDAFTFYNEKSGLTSPKIYSLFEDSKRTIWAGTNEGISYNDEGEFKELALPEGYEKEKEVWDIAELANGDLLFVMADNAIYKYDGKEFKNYSNDQNLDLSFTYNLHVAKDNTLWISTESGLFHKMEDKLIHYTDDDGLASNIVYQVYEHRGFMWSATYSGISRFDGTNFKSYSTDEGIGHREIIYITSDEKGNLWLGTGGGITLLDLDEKGNVRAIENFGKESGMELLTTQVLWFDDSGMLWQGTNGGINQLDVPGYWETGNMDLFHYRLSDRGIGIETNQEAVLPIKENRALFGTMEGVLELSPSNIEQKAEDINLHITSVQRNSQDVEWNDYVDSLRFKFGRPLYPEVSFSYGQHTYAIGYTAVVFGNAANKRFRYKLEGFDEDWSVPAQSQKAIFTNLDPGDYTFVVQAKYGDSEWSANQAQYSFSIAFPFWQTYWFYALVVVSLVGMIYGYIQFHTHMIEKKRLKKLVDEQTENLQNALDEKEVLIKEIHHRVKNNLAVISGLLELQIGYSNDEFSAKVLRQSQRRVQSISMIHEKLYQNKRLAEIDFKKYISELSENIAFSYDNIEKEIDLQVQVDDIHLSIDQGIPCGLILSELLSNAYEHAFKDQQKGSINVKFIENEEGVITFVVSDDGIGLAKLPEENESETLGLTLIQTLTQQLEGDFSIDPMKKGTRFVIKFEKEEPNVQVPLKV